MYITFQNCLLNRSFFFSRLYILSHFIILLFTDGQERLTKINGNIMFRI